MFKNPVLHLPHQWPALASRAEPPLNILVMLVPLTSTSLMALWKVCHLGFLWSIILWWVFCLHLTYPFNMPTASSSLPCSPVGQLRHFYFTQNCPLVSPAENLSILWGPCQDIKSWLWRNSLWSQWMLLYPGLHSDPCDGGPGVCP